MRLLSKLLPCGRRCAAVAGRRGPAAAQQKLKWAHVYETSEPYHTESVVGGRRDQEAHQRQVRHRGVSREHARQGNRHQPGHDARHRRHDHQRAVVRGAQLSAPRHRLLPVHLPRRRSPDRVFEEPGLRRDGRGVPQEDRHPDHSRTPTTARARPPRRSRSPIAPA